MLVRVGPGVLKLTEVHRFSNRPVRTGSTLHWDILALYRGVLDGLRAAADATGGQLAGVGVDSWAVDYGLLDSSGELLGNPVHYRDTRTQWVAEKVAAVLPPADLYAATGVQYHWSAVVAEPLGIDLSLFPPLRRPGDPAGTLRPEVLAETGLKGPVPVTVVASHDTASAVVGVRSEGDDFAYIATGTWSLAGLELPAPILGEASRRANFTNELGIDGTVRFLRNIMGLWLLQECLRTWETEGRPQDLGALLDEAASLRPRRSVVDAGYPAFLAPDGMPRRIADACVRTGQPAPRNRAETVRCVLDSLALAHRQAVEDAQRLSGRSVSTVHIVGGGARNALLCRLTAEATGLPVVAGPAEAAAFGNVLVQARAAGVVSGGRAELRALLRSTQKLRRYEPGAERLNSRARQPH
ncbi:FGGY-family carbohydrate kinase [Streptomyces sp. NPDC005408]|uniref:rhamnulokinase n=1 Tax=Streptomyces sp. NPDC005408 TaxID=3155341 RepID=UPI0033A966B2